VILGYFLGLTLKYPVTLFEIPYDPFQNTLANIGAIVLPKKSFLLKTEKHFLLKTEKRFLLKTEKRFLLKTEKCFQLR
jgi:hypothetical protein